MLMRSCWRAVFRFSSIWSVREGEMKVKRVKGVEGERRRRGKGRRRGEREKEKEGGEGERERGGRERERERERERVGRRRGMERE